MGREVLLERNQGDGVRKQKERFRQERLTAQNRVVGAAGFTSNFAILLSSVTLSLLSPSVSIYFYFKIQVLKTLQV